MLQFSPECWGAFQPERRHQVNKNADRHRISRRQLLKLGTNAGGATAMEYGLIAAGTGLVLAAVLPRTGKRLKRRLRNVRRGLK